jgi:transcriptional regulator with XRE-family HTH domain
MPKNKEAARIGATIHALREAKGLSRAALAHMCGRPPAWITRVETGQTTPDADMIDEIAYALAVPPLAIAYMDALRARNAASSTSVGTLAKSSGVNSAA